MNEFNHIVFVHDSRDYGEKAFEQAVELAHTNKAKLTIIGCFKNLRNLSKNQPSQNILIEEMLEHKKGELEDSIKDLTRHIDAEVNIFLGVPFIEVIREVIKLNADLLIKPVENYGIKNILFESLDLKLLRKCPCPVWLIKSGEVAGDKKVVVAIDYEPENTENELLNKSLLKAAASFAIRLSAEMHVIHAWEFENERFLGPDRVDYKSENIESVIMKDKSERYKWLNDTVGDCLSSLGESNQKNLVTVIHLEEGYAIFKIPELIEKINPELLVMGTVGRTGVSGFFIGNTAENVLFNVDCSVLAMKPKGFVSPVKPQAE